MIKVTKVNHMIDLDNMALVEFETEAPLFVDNDAVNVFRYDYDREKDTASVMVALADSHYVSYEMTHMFDMPDLYRQLDELFTDATPDLTEEYLEAMEEEE